MDTASLKSPLEIEPCFWQIRLPIPIRSLGSVFAYYVKDGGHNLLIDAGWPSESSFAALESSLSEIGASLGEIEIIMISHLHPDHFGLAEQIRDHCPDAKLIMHQADAANIIGTSEEYKSLIDDLHRWLELNGTPGAELKAMLEASEQMLRFFRPPKPTELVGGGEIIRVGDKWSFEVVSTPGHTRGTICLYDRGRSRILFSGDHVLPTITPNISLAPFYMGNPLGDYLDSIKLVSRLDVSTVLPSHEYAFSNLRERVKEIEKHHAERVDDTLSVLSKSGGANNEALSGYCVASKLRWYSGSWESLDAWERRAAVMETLAHLRFLKVQGNVSENESLVGEKRGILYSLVSSKR